MPSSNPVKRLRDILVAIEKIEAYVADIGGVDALIDNRFVHRDAVERQLLVISEAAAKLRNQVDKLEPSIDWDAIRGMGNIIRHDYDQIEDKIIHRVLTVELQPLAKVSKRLIPHFEDQSKI